MAVHKGANRVYANVTDETARRLAKAYFRGHGFRATESAALADVTLRSQGELYVSPYLINSPVDVALGELNAHAWETLGP